MPPHDVSPIPGNSLGIPFPLAYMVSSCGRRNSPTVLPSLSTMSARNSRSNVLIPASTASNFARMISSTARQRARVGVRVGLHANKNVRLAVGVVAVVELGDLPFADRLAEGLEAARPLGDGHRDDRLALLAQFGALGHVAQAVGDA